MFSVLKFHTSHLDVLPDKVANFDVRAWVAKGHAAALEQEQYAFTILKDGVPSIYGGVVEHTTNRAAVWVIFNPAFGGTSFVGIFRIMRKAILSFPYDRLELAVDLDHDFSDMAIRRAQLLGFELEVPRARKYFSHGGDAALLAMVR